MKIRKSLKFQAMHISIAITNMVLWLVGCVLIQQLAIILDWSEAASLVLPPIFGMLIMTPVMLVLDYVDEFICKGRDHAKSWEKYHGFTGLFYQVHEI